MATIQHEPVAKYHSGFRAWKWEGVTENDDCQPLSVANLSDKSIQVFGDFGGGDTEIEGSLDDTEGTDEYATLDDPHGSSLIFSADGIKSVLQNVLKIRPKTPSGTDVSLTIILLAR